MMDGSDLGHNSDTAFTFEGIAVEKSVGVDGDGAIAEKSIDESCFADIDVRDYCNVANVLGRTKFGFGG